MRIVFFVFGLLISSFACAVCPLCTFVAGAGIGMTQYCGIDDVISGLWLGGMSVSLIVLTKNWFEKKKIVFFGRTFLISIFYYGSIIVPFYLSGIMGHELNKCWGIDRLLFGITTGSVFFLAGSLGYNWLKKRNNNRAYFPYQKVVMPLMPLIVLSVIFYFYN